MLVRRLPTLAAVYDALLRLCQPAGVLDRG
jgi:hypothetical protein